MVRTHSPFYGAAATLIRDAKEITLADVQDGEGNAADYEDTHGRAFIVVPFEHDGDIHVETEGGTEITAVAVRWRAFGVGESGDVLPILVQRVFSSGTTITRFLACFLELP